MRDQCYPTSMTSATLCKTQSTSRMRSHRAAESPILAAVETVTTKLRSTLDAAAVQDGRRDRYRGSSTGRSPSTTPFLRSRQRRYRFSGRGRSRYFRRPDVEAGNVPKQLEYLGSEMPHRLGARVPISHKRADKAWPARLSRSPVLARRKLQAKHERQHPPLKRGRAPERDDLLRREQGLSSLKFASFILSLKAR